MTDQRRASYAATSQRNNNTTTASSVSAVQLPPPLPPRPPRSLPSIPTHPSPPVLGDLANSVASRASARSAASQGGRSASPTVSVTTAQSNSTDRRSTGASGSSSSSSSSSGSAVNRGGVAVCRGVPVVAHPLAPPPTISPEEKAAIMIQRNFRRRRFMGYVVKVAAQSRNKKYTVNELRSTELDYIAHMLELRETFQMPLLNQHILTQEKIMILFPCLPKLSAIHGDFLSRLTPVVKDWKPLSHIGALLCEFVGNPEFLEAYRSFVCKFDIIQRHLDLYYQSDKSFRHFVDTRVSQSMGVGKQYLQSLLITIVQRLPRYELLFRDLLKYTYSEHPDTVTIRQAVGTLREITSNINQSTGKEHDWGPVTVPTPGWCRACDQRLMGFGLKGFKCLACNVVVHKECCNARNLAACTGRPVSLNGTLRSVVVSSLAHTREGQQSSL